MLFNKDDKDRLERIEELFKDENRKALFISAMEGRIKELEKQNRELFDRLMSRDFQEFSVFEKHPEDLTVPGKELSEDEDEENAGELLEISDET